MIYIRYGIISEVFPSEGTAKVSFEDDGIVSHKLQILSSAVGDTKVLLLPKIDDFVACIMDEFNEDGVILGGLYTQNNKPNFSGSQGVKFSDGSEIIYDNGNINIKSAQKVTIESSTKIEIKNSAETLGGIVSDLITAIESITHNVTAVGAPTGPPINLPAFASIKSRINAFLD